MNRLFTGFGITLASALALFTPTDAIAQSLGGGIRDGLEPVQEVIESPIIDDTVTPVEGIDSVVIEEPAAPTVIGNVNNYYYFNVCNIDDIEPVVANIYFDNVYPTNYAFTQVAEGITIKPDTCVEVYSAYEEIGIEYDYDQSTPAFDLDYFYLYDQGSALFVNFQGDLYYIIL